MNIITGDFRWNVKKINLSRRSRGFGITHGVPGVILAALKRAPVVSRRHIYKTAYLKKKLARMQKKERAKSKTLPARAGWIWEVRIRCFGG